jgi:hypothetical protein
VITLTNIGAANEGVYGLDLAGRLGGEVGSAMSLEKIKYNLIRARSQIWDAIHIEEDKLGVDAVPANEKQGGEQRTAMHVRRMVWNRCKLSIAISSVLDSIHSNMLDNALQHSKDSSIEDRSTIYYSGVGGEDGIMRSHVSNTRPMLGELFLIIDPTICSGRATLKHLASKPKGDSSSKGEGSIEG